MATIKNTKLTIGAGSQTNKANVTVTSEIEFTQADEGYWRVQIRLFGDDAAEGGGTALIYTFRFGLLPLKDFKYVQATPGVITINESREIDLGVLDEDPGVMVPQNAPPGTPGLPRKDEVFAVVNLGREGKSNTWTSFGV